MKKESSEHCSKFDCCYWEACKWDMVHRFLCGQNKDFYGIYPPGLSFQEIKRELKEIDDADSTDLGKIGTKLGIKRENFDDEQYRVLLQYKVQEQYRMKHNLQIPQPIKNKIIGVMNQKVDGILYTGIRSIYSKGGDMAKGTKKAKDKMAKVRAAKGKRTGPTVRDIAEAAIKAKLDYEGAKKKVLAVYPDSRFSKACYSWYRSKMGK